MSKRHDLRKDPDDLTHVYVAQNALVELTADYIQSCHDYRVAIKDKVDEHHEIYYHTLTQEE